MGGRLEVGFQELLPHNSSRRTASRALSHVLGELALQGMREPALQSMYAGAGTAEHAGGRGGSK